MERRLTDARIRRGVKERTNGQLILREPGGYMAVVGARGVALSLHTKRGRKKIADWDGANCDQVRLLAEQHRQGGFEGPTLRDAWDDYRAELERRNKSPITVRNYADLVERVMKELLDVPLAKLAEDNRPLRELFNRYTDDGKLHQADNMLRAISAIYNHARRVDKKALPDKDGPTYGIPLNKPQPSKTTIKDLAAWNQERLALPSPLRREMHLFALLSGLRKNDLLTAQWANLDVANRALLIPKPKGGRAFRVPLSRPMLACLNRAKNAGDFLMGKRSEWIFPSDSSKTGHVSENKENGRPDFAYGHVLRKTYATIAYGVVGKDLVARMLNHAAEGITESRYIDFDALHSGYVKAQEEISNEILQRLGLT